MTSLRAAIGKPVIRRDDAEAVGNVSAFAVDGGAHRVTSVLVGSGRATSVA